MIDTDKYEGHTEGHKEGSWDIYEVYGSDNKLMKCIRPLHDKWGVDLPLVASKDAQLIADAPLLLAEVKRLREENERLHEAIRGCDSHKCTWLYEGTYKEMTKHD